MATEHPLTTRFRDEHARRGGTGEIVILPESAHTAALAAAALGCEVGAIANSLLFDGDGEPVLVLTSGAHRVDTAAGHPAAVFSTSYDELVAMTGAVEVEVD